MNTLIPKLITAIMSILDAANLRNKMYIMKDEHERMWTCLDDIARMHPDHDSGERAKRLLTNIETKYGR